MTQFWFGFITAVAVIAVGIIGASMVYVARKNKAGRAKLNALLESDEASLLAAFQALRERVAFTPGPMTDEDTRELAALLQRLEARGIDIQPLLRVPIPANPQGKKGLH